LDPRAIGTLAGHLACDVGDTTTDRANDGNPTWSQDGFTLTPPVLDNSSCGRCLASGGDAIQVFGPHESPDGRFLHYAKALFDIRLWRIPVEGRLAARVLENLSRHLNVALAASGIYFVPTPLRVFPFSSLTAIPIELQHSLVSKDALI